MSELYQEFANFSGVNDEADSSNETSSVDEMLSKPYTKEDENRSRKLAEDMLRRESARQTADQAKAYNSRISSEIEQLRQEKASMKAEMDALKNEILGVKSGYGALKGDIDTHTERMIIDEVNKEEEALLQDPVYGSLYDRNTIRKVLADEARNGRVLTPKEALALKEFDRLARENAELKQTIDHRKRFFENPIGISASRVSESAELSGVNDLSSATAYAKKLAKAKFGY